MAKRKGGNFNDEVKRPRTDDQMVVRRSDDSLVVHSSNEPERTSGLKAPNMQLTGHSAKVLSVKFDPTGKSIATGSFDRNIFLWDVYGECKNYGVLKGHTNAVMDVQWSSDSSTVYSASADKSVSVWDAKKCYRFNKYRGHTGIVNSCASVRRGPPLIVTGSDDTTAMLWDTRMKRAADTMAHQYPVTSVCFSDGADQVFCGGIDNTIQVWDLRKLEVVMKLEGHTDTITGMALSPSGSHLLSNCMDSTLRSWDIRPFCPENRCVKTFRGAKHNYEKSLLKCSWSFDGEKVLSGSTENTVFIWDHSTTELLYHLPGHKGTVNEVVYHPNEPIIASCSNDKTIFLGELV